MTRPSAVGGKLGLWQKAIMRMLWYYLETEWYPPADKEWLLTEFGLYWPWDDAAYPCMLNTACLAGKPEIDMLVHSQGGWPELEEYLIAWRKDILRVLRTLEGKELLVRNKIAGGPIGSRKTSLASPNERLMLTTDGKLRAEYEFNALQCDEPGGGCACNLCRSTENWHTLLALVPARYFETEPLTERQQQRQELEAERDYWEQRREEQRQERQANKMDRIGAIYEVNADGERQLVGFH